MTRLNLFNSLSIYFNSIQQHLPAIYAVTDEVASFIIVWKINCVCERERQRTRSLIVITLEYMHNDRAWSCLWIISTFTYWRLIDTKSQRHLLCTGTLSSPATIFLSSSLDHPNPLIHRGNLRSTTQLTNPTIFRSYEAYGNSRGSFFPDHFIEKSRYHFHQESGVVQIFSFIPATCHRLSCKWMRSLNVIGL